MTPTSPKQGERKEKLPRCNALDSDGNRCRKHSAIKHDYHGDSESYYNFPSRGKPVKWVRINLCIDHAVGVSHDFTKRPI